MSKIDFRMYPGSEATLKACFAHTEGWTSVSVVPADNLRYGTLGWLISNPSLAEDPEQLSVFFKYPIGSQPLELTVHQYSSLELSLPPRKYYPGFSTDQYLEWITIDWAASMATAHQVLRSSITSPLDLELLVSLERSAKMNAEILIGPPDHRLSLARMLSKALGGCASSLSRLRGLLTLDSAARISLGAK